MAENGMILFRGKSKEKSEWIYGSLLQDDYGNSCIVCFVDHHEEWHDVESESEEIECEECGHVEIGIQWVRCENCDLI